MEKNKIMITVIITIHNAEKYLEECLTSVRNQTYQNIEILCVDGGSTDSSPIILKSHQEHDSRICIINDSNTSYGHKVNIGIKQAQGKYIAVLESDDMYELYMLEKLIEIAERYHTDIVNAEFRYFYTVNNKKFYIPHQMFHKQPYNCLIEQREQPENLEIPERYWTGLFSKDFLKREKIKLNETPGASFQDMSFRFLTSILADRVYHLDIPVYRYRMDNPDSSMKDPSKTLIIADEHDYLKKELLKRNIKNCYIWKMAYYWKYMDFYGNISRLQGTGRIALFERYQKEIQKDLNYMPDYSIENYPHTESIIWEQPLLFLQEIEDAFQKYQMGNEALRKFFSEVTSADQIVVFGCGKRGKTVVQYLQPVKEKICCYVDNSQELWGTLMNDIMILPPDEAIKKYPNALYVVANKFASEEIRKQLLGCGIKERNIHIFMGGRRKI